MVAVMTTATTTLHELATETVTVATTKAISTTDNDVVMKRMQCWCSCVRCPFNNRNMCIKHIIT